MDSLQLCMWLCAGSTPYDAQASTVIADPLHPVQGG